MSHHFPIRSLRPARWAAWTLTATLLGASTLAGAATASAETNARYQRDRAACMSTQAADDRATCLSNARAAFDSAQPQTANLDPGRYERNATKRCEVHPEAERADCVARIQGAGRISGSVESGGILRELVTLEVGEPAMPASSHPALPAR